MKNDRIEALILTLGTALGTALLGWFIYLGIAAFANKDRYVSVRGLAEREVKADHVIWPIVYKTTGNDLQKLHAHINIVGRDISQFLTSNGIETKEISLGAPQIIDVHADRYAGSDARLRDRYNVTFVVTVASNKVDVVRSLISRVGELLQKGIAISANEYGTNVEYEFQSLNKIKPQMIEEATRNAREAADKFAKDSGSDLGKIRQATQGVFSIEDRDQYSPYIKNVRVVTSVSYFLES